MLISKDRSVKKISFARFVLFGTILGSLFGIGCAQPVLRVTSDRSEIAVLVELYNATQDDVLGIFHYSEQPKQLISSTEPPVDVVVTEDLHHEFYADYFISTKDMVDDAEIYDLLRSTQGTWTLPLSFDVPLILSQHDTFPHQSRILARELQLGYDETTEEQRIRHFSPQWAAAFLVYTLRSRGVRFFEGSERDIQWNANAVEEAAEFLRTWNLNIAPVAVQDHFIEKNFTIPFFRLIQLDRIGYHWSTANAFFSLHPLDQRDIRATWLDHDTGIWITTSVGAGVTKTSRQKRQAKAFITWLLDPNTQKFYLENKEDLGIRSFGFVGGFSSLYPINETFIQREIGDIPIPLPSELQFSLPHLRDWQGYAQQVLEPWITTYIRSDDAYDGAVELGAATQKWTNQGIR